MRKQLLLLAIFFIFLVDSIAFVYSIPAESTPDNLVEATLTCIFDTGSHLIVQAHMIANNINVFDTSYDRQTIENIATSNPYVMGAIMLRLHESIKTQVETAFTDAYVDTLNTMLSYENPYFIDNFQVNLTSSFFKYNGSLNLTEFIPGALDMGATVTYHFNLQSEHGWNTTYQYILPNTMTLAYANTADTDVINNKVSWIVRNFNGTAAGKQAILSVQSKNPTTIVSETEDVSLEFTLDARNENDISFIDSILIKKVNVRNYNVLPEFISGLESIPADGVRLCINTGLFSWEDFFENTIQPVQQDIFPYINNSSFDQNLNLSFSWDVESTTNCSTPYNISYMDDTPAIRANFNDFNVDLMICQISARAFLGLINAGANASISSSDMNFGVGLEGIKYPYDILLRLPANISLNGENVYTWNRTTPLNGIFTSEIQPNPPYSAERIDTYIEIELLKLDMNIQSVFTGKTELTASTKMKEDDRFYVIRRNDVLYLSPKVNITYLNADAFRLCIEENVFNETQISSFLSLKTDASEQLLSEIFSGASIKGIIDSKIFANSLVWDRDISVMEDMVPIVVSNYANAVYAIGFNISLWPAEMTIAPQRFILQSLPNQTVIYRIIFPQGITVNASESIGISLITGKTNDGREYVELSFDAESATQSTILTCALNVSPVYIIGLFLPCLFIFILLIVLVVIIYLIRKRRGGLRRGKRKVFESDDNESSDYDGEDYYVPPPPTSIKKKK